MLERISRRGLHLAAALAAAGCLLAFASVGPPYDFCTYYTAGHLAIEGDLEAPYDFAAINARHRELHPGEGVRIGSFLYSPVFLHLAGLLSALPFSAAIVVNQLLILLSLGGIVFLVLESTESLWLRALFWLVFVLSDPVTNQFIYQNWSAHLALFVALALFCTFRDRGLPSALFWALAVHLKAYVGLFLLPLLLCGRRRLVAGILVAGIALIVVGLPWTGLDSYLTYFDAMGEQSSGWITYFFNQVSVQSTLARYEFPPAEWQIASAAPQIPFLDWIFWISLPLYGIAVYRLRDDEPRALALTIPYLLLFVPKIWDHTEILFYGVFVAGALVSRTKAILLGYLLLSFAYFPLVQHLLSEAIRGSGPAAIVHAVLLYYPVLNLLTLLAIVGPQEERLGARPRRASLPSPAKT
jgi:hypothetical protein